MRSFSPVPLMRVRSTLSCRANARTDGDACAFLNRSLSTFIPAASPGGRREARVSRSVWAEGCDAPGAGAGVADGAAARGASLVCCGALTPGVSSVKITLPSLTLSPTLTLSSLIFPPDGDGTSIVALSDSSVTSASSGLTSSPAFTRTSITGTSLKSPMSGTLISTTAA